jgi:hypothetical protein
MPPTTVEPLSDEEYISDQDWDRDDGGPKEQWLRELRQEKLVWMAKKNDEKWLNNATSEQRQDREDWYQLWDDFYQEVCECSTIEDRKDHSLRKKILNMPPGEVPQKKIDRAKCLFGKMVELRRKGKDDKVIRKGYWGALQFLRHLPGTGPGYNTMHPWIVDILNDAP